MAIQIGKYKRPGIFIEEFDNSVITSPTVNGITTLVVGFSKKGPQNTPVLVQNLTDFQRIFGNLDRNLERKGSFFHRTVSQMLQSSPVYAMSLLQTDDTLDLIDYKSVSTSTDKSNDIVRQGAYRRFFDTTGFWKRSTDSFITVTKSDNSENKQDRLLAFTNLSDKPITIFAFKSKVNGFDTPLIQWYGSIDQVPSFLNPLDYASDYLLDIIVVAGDWSNYQQLSVDSIWSHYFDASGLLKSQVNNFANNRNVNLLAYYEGLSLIPYFRDSNGKNIFIETNINQDTNKTGLFCAFDADKFETDYTNGLIDLIGNNLVETNSFLNADQPTTDIDNVNFLSYQEKITENVEFETKYLDQIGNVIALDGGLTSNLISGNWGYPSLPRSTFFAESTIWGLDGDPMTSDLSGTSSLTIAFTGTNPTNMISEYQYFSGPFTINNGNLLYINSNNLTINSSSYPVLTSTASYYATAYINDATGNVSLKTTLTPNTKPTLTYYDVALGYVKFDVANGSIVQNPFTSTITLASIGSVGDDLNISLTYPSWAFNPSGTTTLSGYTQSISVATTDDLVNEIVSYYIGLSTPFVLGTASGGIITITAPLGMNIDFSYNGVDQLYLPTTVGNLSTYTSVTSYRGGNTPVYVDLLKPDMISFNQNDGDYQIDQIDSTTIKVSFTQSSTADVYNDYEGHRKKRMFAYMISKLETTNLHKASIISDFTTFEKLPLENASISNVVTSALYNKSFELNLGTTVPTDVANGNLAIYITDYEYFPGKLGFKTTNTVDVTGLTYGVVSKYSTFYLDFYNGQINTGDYFRRSYFYSDLKSDLSGASVPNSLRTVLTNQNGYNYIVFAGLSHSYTLPWDFEISQPSSGIAPFNGDEIIILPESILNTGKLTLEGSTTYSVVDPTTGVAFNGNYLAYRLSTEVMDEDLTVTRILSGEFEWKAFLQIDLDTSNNLTVNFTDNTLISPSSEIDLNYDQNFSVVSNRANFQQTLEIVEPSGYTPVGNKILIESSRYTEVQIGDFLEAYVDETNLVTGEVPRRLTRIITRRAYTGDATLVELTCDAEILKEYVNGTKQTMRYASLDNYVSTYKAITMNGFKMREASAPDGTEAQQSAILNLIANGTPLFNALTNKEAIDFRYVVDSFGLGLIERSKQQLVDVCGQRLDCLGFINMPSMKSFKNSSSPSFIDSDKTSPTYGTLQTSYIAQGGDLSSNPAFLYSFGDGRGVSSVGYFLPYVTVNDNGRPADVPPAMFVATTYMRKQNSNVTSITPWTIAAGVTNGKITNIAGIEMDFTPSDIENLNGAQMNPIVYKKNRGWQIETENTGQTLYKSALSYLHVREVLIELERELSAMLLDFQWKFNTAEVRAEIKLRADVICEKYVNKNGLYNYFNKCDEENNTQQIIDSQIGVLDTFIEPIRGMGIIVNNITILRTGAINSGGFINQ